MFNKENLENTEKKKSLRKIPDYFVVFPSGLFNA